MHAVALPENLIRVIIVWEVAKGHLDLVERTRKVVGERRDCAYVRVKAAFELKYGNQRSYYFTQCASTLCLG